MKHILTRFTAIGTGAILFSVWPVQARNDYYTANFYSRGTDAASDIDRGDDEFEPFYIPVTDWSILPRVTLTATRDDNLFLDAQGTEDGTVVDLIPGVMAIYGRPDHNHLYADYGSIIPLYNSSDLLDDNPSHMLTLGGVYQTGKSQIQGRAGYRRLESLNTLVGARILKEDWIGDVEVEHRLTSKSSASIVGAVELHEFDDPEYVDYQRTYGAGRFYHRMTARSEAFVQGGVGRDDLDTKPDDFGDADFFDLSVGVRGKPSPKTSASGRVGHMWRKMDSAELNDVDDWIASLAGEANPFGLTTFSTELYSDIRPAINSAGSTTIDQRLSVGLMRRLFTERLRGNASVFLGVTDYQGPVAAPARFSESDPLVYDGREDQYWGYALGLDWWAQKNLSFGLAYSYVQNEGSQETGSESTDRTSYDSGRWTFRTSWNY